MTLSHTSPPRHHTTVLLYTKMDDLCSDCKATMEACTDCESPKSSAPKRRRKLTHLQTISMAMARLQDDLGRNAFTKDILYAKADDVAKEYGDPVGLMQRSRRNAVLASQIMVYNVQELGIDSRGEAILSFTAFGVKRLRDAQVELDHTHSSKTKRRRLAPAILASHLDSKGQRFIEATRKDLDVLDTAMTSPNCK
ncbi:hypothetical protein BD410DRAFT_899803 [Rickenella mellea]|uniref:Uncharacterized protein n=1 Tax=Rickenella mellea TaxID=50990 RepID=A0A4Y7PY45_9AGAM|nr:hypothetical protein BD410DRAFT_899803 [Rickenella mellea]